MMPLHLSVSNNTTRKRDFQLFFSEDGEIWDEEVFQSVYWDFSFFSILAFKLW